MPIKCDVFDLKKPVDRINASTSSRSAAANSRGPGKRRKSAGVTRLTRSSVHCAERIVATRSWKAPLCFSAQSCFAVPG